MNPIRRLILPAVVAVGVTLSPAVARACPLCETETCAKVRAGIFGSNLSLTLLPFPVLAGLVLLVHYGFPNPKPGSATRVTNAERGDS